VKIFGVFVYHVFKRNITISQFKLSHVFIVVDKRRAVVNQSRSILSLRRNSVPSLNVEFENTPGERRNKPIQMQLGV